MQRYIFSFLDLFEIYPNNIQYLYKLGLEKKEKKKNSLTRNASHYATTFSRSSYHSNHARRFDNVIRVVVEATQRYFRPGRIGRRSNKSIKHFARFINQKRCTNLHIIIAAKCALTLTCRYYISPRSPINFARLLKTKEKKKNYNIFCTNL